MGWGKAFRKLLLGIILFIFILPFVQSAAPVVTPTISESRITIQHDQTETVTISIINRDPTCKVNCYFTVDSGPNIPLGQIGNNGGQSSAPYYITAPAKSTDTITKKITIDCSRVTGFYGLVCSDQTHFVDSQTISVTYALTDDEQLAKDYLSSQIQSIAPLIIEIDTNIQAAQYKINSLPANVKKVDLTVTSSTLSDTFSSTKRNFQNVQNLYNNQDYIQARNAYSTTTLQSLQSLKPSIDKLLTDIEARLAFHNKVAEAIASLTKKLNKYNEVASSSGSQQEYVAISNKISLLAQNFNTGNFATYENVQNNVQELEQEIDQSATKWQQKLQDIINTAESILESEYARLCRLKQYCKAPTLRFELSASGLSNACGVLKQNLINDFHSANDNTLKEYQQMLSSEDQRKSSLRQENDRIQKINNDIKSYNRDLDKTNSIIEQLSSTINKYRLELVNLTECQQLISRANSTLDFAERSTLTLQVENSCELDLEAAKEQAKEKNKSFFFRLKQVLTFFLRSNIAHLEKIKPLEEQPLKDVNDSVILKPVDIEPEQKTNDFATTACNLNLQALAKSEVLIPLAQSKTPIVTSTVDTSLKEVVGQCCLFGQCSQCCNGSSCQSNPALYPIIFVHGHQAFLASGMDALSSFVDFQNKLQEQGFVGEGFILPNILNSDKAFDWASFGKPITVRTTYYVDSYDANGALAGPQISENINAYAGYLSKVVDEVLRRTKKGKVILISHSMGGLVSRAYIENLGGQNKVYKLITLGTPNQGILSDTSSLANFCKLGQLFRPECSDMLQGSNFLKTLNSETFPTASLQVKTVAVNSTSDNTDGLIAVKSVAIPAAENNIIQGYAGKCSGLSGCHSVMLNPVSIPEVYNYVVDFLKK